MSYLDYDSFKNKYLDIITSNNLIGQGSYGAVYATDTHIVKVQNDFIGFMRELNICNSLKHPCIISIDDWSIDNIKGLYMFSQPKGSSLIEAIKNGSIGLYQAICDIYNGIKFLHDRGIVHLDIKIDNTIFLNGKAVIIDFGLATYGYRYENGLFSYKNVGYTPNFLDPEYSSTNFNSSNSDLYAFAVTVIKLYQISQNKPSPMFVFDVDSVEDLNISNMCNECMKPLTDRRDDLIEFIESNSIFDNYTFDAGTQIESPPIPIDSECGIQYTSLVNFINGIMINGKFITSTRTGFLTHHLIHRCLSLLAPGYTVDSSMQEYANQISIACFYLAYISFDYIPNFEEEIIRVSSVYMNKQLLLRTSINILIVLNGVIVTPTYWDYAKQFEDLYPFITKTCSCEYDYKNIPGYTNPSFTNDKNKYEYSYLEYFRPGYRFDNFYSNPQPGKIQIISRRMDVLADKKYDLVKLVTSMNSIPNPNPSNIYGLKSIYLSIYYRQFYYKFPDAIKRSLDILLSYFPKSLKVKYFGGLVVQPPIVVDSDFE